MNYYTDKAMLCGLRRRLIVLFILVLSSYISIVAMNSFHVVPTPTIETRENGEFLFSPQTTIAVENEEQRISAELFANLFHASAGFRPIVSTGNVSDATIRLKTDKTMGPEAYALRIVSDSIEMRASDAAGFFYAFQTLRHMLPTDIEYSYPRSLASWTVACGEIIDAPRFEYRGLMLDVSRYFIPKETVLEIIEALSSLKINKLHLHLVDDNGWRLEIKGYPALTDIGAWRVDRRGIPFPERRNPSEYEPATVGGFYTQDDMREIISFAADRHVEVIPEIEIPAHTISSLAAYPELACPVVDEFIGVLPGLGGDNARIIYCAGNEDVYTFLENILDEVMALFPSKYIHLGGDEANKYHWERCPLCQSKMKEENISDEEHLQSYFMQRISQYVQSNGKEVMGWDEITNGEIPDGAIIFGWEAKGQKALKATSQGHRVVMTPAQVLYLIRYQGPQWFEPLTYFGNNTLNNVYSYEPVQSNWNERDESLLMGVQASLWTEFCSSPEDVQYLLFPRLIAFADMAWRPKGSQNWTDFLPRLDAFTERLTAKRITHAPSMFNLDHSITPTGNGMVEVAITSERPDVSIHYTVDGSIPSINSPLYEEILSVDKTTLVRAATFMNNKQMGQLLTLPIRFNKATGATIEGSANGNLSLLTNGLRGSDKYTDFEWCGWYGSDFSLTLDLGSLQPVNLVTLGTITNYGMAVHQPSAITILVSEDNKDFSEVAQFRQSHGEIFREGTFIEDKTLLLKNVAARYIRIEGENPGICPPEHARPGQNSWVYIDEIIVE